MKKIIGTLLVISCLLAVPAQAQLRWGLKGGVNLAKASFSHSDLKSDNFTGFFVGPTAEFTIPMVGLGVDGSLLFSQRGLKIKGDDKSIKQNGLEIPINLKYTFGFSSLAAVYLAAGPSFIFDFSKDKGIKNITEIKQENAQVAINIGAGVKLLDHLQIGANYSIPVTKTAKLQTLGIDNASYKTRNWQVSLAYWF